MKFWNVGWQGWRFCTRNLKTFCSTSTVKIYTKIALITRKGSNLKLAEALLWDTQILETGKTSYPLFLPSFFVLMKLVLAREVTSGFLWLTEKRFSREREISGNLVLSTRYFFCQFFGAWPPKFSNSRWDLRKELKKFLNLIW